MKRMIFSGLFLTSAAMLFAGGAKDSNQISPADAKAMLAQDSSIVLMDVRTMEEFTSGHIAGAQLLPYDQITAATAPEFIPNKDTTVIVYCRSGHRAGVAVTTLKNLGYTHVLNLGGIMDWPYETVAGAK